MLVGVEAGGTYIDYYLSLWFGDLNYKGNVSMEHVFGYCTVTRQLLKSIRYRTRIEIKKWSYIIRHVTTMIKSILYRMTSGN